MSLAWWQLKAITIGRRQPPAHARLDGSPLCYNKPDILNPWFVARA
jgi:hypothetical protein